MSQRTQSFDAELAELAELDRRDSEGLDSEAGALGDDGAAQPARDSATMPAATLGRFALLELLGEGGMGSVYAAYDPSLDRKVALKLVRYARQTAVSRDRMLREAQALAKLSHPNVVAVHEVGTFADQLFLVMEFVRGQNLRDWSEGERRGWREVVAAYAQAARGLSAAHAAGLVHRDVKPSNLVIGDDGRVRLIDFGLARRDDVSGEERGDAATSGDAPGGDEIAYAETAEAVARGAAITPESHPGAPGRDNDSGSLLVSARRLTIPGARLGTPGFMAPEQIEGGELGPATDQFALCVALWEALYGARPFDGSTLDRQLEQIAAGDIAAPPPGRTNGRSVPRHIDAAVRRGLAYRAGDRFDSLDALVAELARDPARTRRRVALAAAGLLGALGLGAVAASGLDRGPSCDIGDGRAATVWNDSSRAAVSAAVATLPAGAEVWALVEPRLDDYVTRWKVMHRQACETHKAGTQSDQLFDARMRCLERRYDQMGAAVGILREPRRGDTEVDAAKLVAGLEPIDACGDLEALSAAVPLPDSAEQRAAVEAIQTRLDENAVTEAAGFSVEAMDTARTLVADADDVGYQPLVAEANLQLGRAAIGAMRVKDSLEPLERSLNAALAVGAKDIAAEAQVRLLWGLTNQGKWERDDLDRGAGLAEALVAAASPPAGLDSLLQKNIGESLIALGEKTEAVERLERALAMRPAHQRSRYATELAKVTKALAFASEDVQRRAKLLRQAVEELRELVGANHPMTLEAECSVGTQVQDAAAALEHLSRGLEGYRTHLPNLVRVRAPCEYTAATVLLDLGKRNEAIAMFQSAASLYAETPGVEARAARSEGFALLLAGEPRRARESFEASAAVYQKLSPEKRWWIALELAEAELGIAMSMLATDEGPAAERLLAGIVSTLEGLLTVAPHGLTPRALARARLAWARAAVATNNSASATVALDSAEEWYVNTAHNDVAVREVSALRSRLR